MLILASDLSINPEHKLHSVARLPVTEAEKVHFSVDLNAVIGETGTVARRCKIISAIKHCQSQHAKLRRFGHVFRASSIPRLTCVYLSALQNY